MNTFTSRADAVAAIVAAIEATDAAADAAAEYDINAIADAVIGAYADGYAQTVDTDEFWRIVAAHTRFPVDSTFHACCGAVGAQHADECLRAGMSATDSQLTAWWDLHDVGREVGVDVDQLRVALHDLEDQLDNGAPARITDVDQAAAAVRHGVIAVCRKGTDEASTLTAAQLFRAADALDMPASELLGVTA